MSLKSCLRHSLKFFALSPLAVTALGAGFTAGISPSRFELTVRPGDVIRDTITVINPGNEPATYLFKTADWRLNESSSVEYIEDDLVSDSCRPWVRLERRAVEIGPGAEKNYRFEVHVPENASHGLCRFAIIIEPVEPYEVNAAAGGVTMPVVGRFAVLSYVTIGDASADISFLGLEATEVNGMRVPALRVRNQGETYDRMFGQVTATDASGRRFSLRASDFPVLPGRTESIALIPETGESDSAPPVLEFPVRLDGRVEIGGETLRVEGLAQ